jgi:hypothetical protein
MGLYESILNSLGVAVTDLPCSYRVTVCGGIGAYIEGVKKIIDVSAEKIILEVKNCKLTVEGKGLKLTSFVSGDASIKGDVLSVLKN